MLIISYLRRAVLSFRKPRSDLCEQLTHPNIERFCHPNERGDGGVFLSTFHPPKIIGMEIGFLRQSFNGEASARPLLADRFSEDDAVITGR